MGARNTTAIHLALACETASWHVGQITCTNPWLQIFRTRTEHPCELCRRSATNEIFHLIADGTDPRAKLRWCSHWLCSWYVLWTAGQRI